MTDKDLRKLTRADLLEMLLEQSKELEETRAQLEAAFCLFSKFLYLYIITKAFPRKSCAEMLALLRRTKMEERDENEDETRKKIAIMDCARTFSRSGRFCYNRGVCRRQNGRQYE